MARSTINKELRLCWEKDVTKGWWRENYGGQKCNENSRINHRRFRKERRKFNIDIEAAVSHKSTSLLTTRWLPNRRNCEQRKELRWFNVKLRWSRKWQKEQRKMNLYEWRKAVAKTLMIRLNKPESSQENWRKGMRCWWRIAKKGKYKKIK